MELTYQSFGEFDQKFSQKIQETKQHMKTVAGDFVEIGYLLRRAWDTDVLQGSGYKSIYEYAQEKYGVDRSEVSRYIRINRRFSEGGYSEVLREQYQDFGVAKLAIMLQLPDTLNEELSPDFSKAEIQDIKAAVEEEKKITDIEVCLEESPAWQQDDPAYQAFLQLFHDEPELYLEACKVKETDKELFLSLAPAGEKIYTVRVAGTGRLMLSIKEETDIALINVRTGEKQTYPKKAIASIIQEILFCPSGQEKEHWKELYQEDFPAREEPEKPNSRFTNTSRKKETPQEDVRKDKVQEEAGRPERTVNDPEKEIVAPVQPNNGQKLEKDKVEVVPGVEVVIENVGKAQEAAERETMKAEIMAVPEHTEEPEDMKVVSGEVENPANRENTQHEPVLEMPPEERERRMQTYFKEFETSLNNARTDVKKDMYDLALSDLEYAVKMIKQMQELYLSEEEA